MKTNAFIHLFVRNSLWQHLLFWALSFYLLLRIFSGNNAPTRIDYIYNGLFHLTLLPGVYVNLLIFIPRMLGRNKYLLYLLLMMLTIALSSAFNILFFEHLVDYVLPGYYFISYYEFYDIAQFFIAYLGLTTLLKLSKAWFQLSASEKRLSIAEKEKLDAELRALKSQINPHFLFNSLNNLYALSLKEDKQTPAFILKLSEVMRYMIYESNADFVFLKKELNFIKNYVALQKLRSDQRARISFHISGKVGKQKLAPLLFIPFVENSFKHGIKGETGDSYVNIHMEVTGNELLFKVENNKGAVDEVEKGHFNGIGLTNVRQRLALMYPEKHQLTICDEDKTFSVQLKLTLS